MEKIDWELLKLGNKKKKKLHKAIQAQTIADICGADFYNIHKIFREVYGWTIFYDVLKKELLNDR